LYAYINNENGHNYLQYDLDGKYFFQAAKRADSLVVLLVGKELEQSRFVGPSPG
jgi:hypothetical protein